ncbi:uncharacterized protein LOC106639096 [Copidosoma floridanum]|uniref:uncharacterized protein LOC106639096 n=1 Tax=Copidosoma floridanum TaxID=29053 RepID=UPI0006C96CCA|nr:uncharacterized protein LOC106639096 [Copidosoma floridanum]
MSLFLKPESSSCCCPPMPGPADPCPPTTKPETKYVHEVGAEMIDNQLIIRMEKDKSRKKKTKRANWEPPCDCDVIEIKRPTSKREKPEIVNGGDNNQILFRIHSKGHLHKKEDPNYKPQAIAYKINRSGPETDRSRKITIYPQLGGPISQDVYTDHITEEDDDVYLLRVKKKNDAGGKKRNVEVELRTPKPPAKPKTREPEIEANEATDVKPEVKKNEENEKKTKNTAK